MPVTTFGLPGVATVPRHVPARRVRSVIRADVAALFRGLTPEVVESVPEVLDDGARRAGQWLMAVRADDGRGDRAEGWVTDPTGTA
ncbi:hypothetical protein [Actinoallomurus sp. NPDC052274]|uniref:hypothetical protein n=1 Tax=Actinoallomurus sp. NPDC052274 TaxID=3155420 RepID=UPI003414FC76